MSAAAAAKSLQSCLTVQPHRRQPTRLACPWDSPGKNTGVGCHFLLQCMKVKSESEVAHSCLTLSDPMDCSLPGLSTPGIFQARVLEWVTIVFSENGLEWVNLTQMTIISTTVDRNPLEEIEWPSWSTKESKMQYLHAISKTTE